MGLFGIWGMLMLTIEEQKKYLFDRLKVEKLCFSEKNREDIVEFEQAASGNNIANYLKDEAWKDDNLRNTKVYLVRDIFTEEIVYYFAINCGILYSEIEEIALNESEKNPFYRYIKAVRGANRKGLTTEQRDKANEELKEAMNGLYNATNSADRASYLFNCAENKAVQKEEEIELFHDTEETEHTMNVQETFPAIDIKFLCRNKKYVPSIKLDFKIGVYIFWEIIVPLLLDVAETVGCKYVYLFAADNSERRKSKASEPIMYTQDYNPDDDSFETENKEEVLKLVRYYQSELKFEYVTKYKILKPKYERKCFTLIQKVDDLRKNRDDVWMTLIPVDDSSEG